MKRWLAGVITVVVMALSAGANARGATLEGPLVRPGLGVFTFAGYPPLADRPVQVYYSAPADPAHAKILIVMHGLSRDGKAHRDDWADLVGDRNVLVLVPEFTTQLYPDGGAYNIGNVVDASGSRQPPEQWTFHVVEALFDAVTAGLGSAEQDYALFGFSGGGQFVHRFVELMPRHRARVAIAANSGWYTMPDDGVPFPYGLGGAPVRSGELGPAFASNLVVLLGGTDTNPNDPSLKRDQRSDRQGSDRLTRGLTFYHTARELARSSSSDFRWRLQVVPGLGHSHPGAARAALPYVLEGG